MKKIPAGPPRPGRPHLYTSCGILMHSSLVITHEGQPLGLAAIKFWSRDKFHGANRLKRKVNPTRVPIERKESIRWLENVRQASELLGDPGRCVHIGDRESDIYELFCLAGELGTHFVVRTCVDRLACDGQTTVGAEMKLSEVRGLHPVEIRNIRGEAETAILEMRFRRILVRPPRDKEKKYPELVLTAIYAQERGTPKRSERASLSPSQTRTTRSSSLGWSLMSDTSSSTRPTFALFHARGDEERAPERDRPSDLHLPEI